ncbi:MAG: type II secretion system protein [Firmicutes bacterium]|nr:type II secretion system protein [Bacillota bacterium]
MNNKKGFTLVELLAVIVVLAIIILVAMPNVLSAMDKARRNALVTEASEFAKIAQAAYSDDAMNGGLTTGNSETGYCYSMDYLINKGYMDKKKGGNDHGSVLLQVSNTGETTYTIWLSNGTYSINGRNVKDITATGKDGGNPAKAYLEDGGNASDNCGSQGTLRS